MIFEVALFSVALLLSGCGDEDKVDKNNSASCPGRYEGRLFGSCVRCEQFKLQKNGDECKSCSHDAHALVCEEVSALRWAFTESGEFKKCTDGTFPSPKLRDCVPGSWSSASPASKCPGARSLSVKGRCQEVSFESFYDPKSDSIESCEAGKYSWQSLFVCEKCEPGKFFNGRDCVEAAEDQYFDEKTGVLTFCGYGAIGDKTNLKCVPCIDLGKRPASSGRGCEACPKHHVLDKSSDKCVPLKRDEIVGTDGKVDTCTERQVPSQNREWCDVCFLSLNNEIGLSKSPDNNANICEPCPASAPVYDSLINRCRTCYKHEQMRASSSSDCWTPRLRLPGANCPSWATNSDSECCPTGQYILTFSWPLQCTSCPDGEVPVGGLCQKPTSWRPYHTTLTTPIRPFIYSTDVFCGVSKNSREDYAIQFVREIGRTTVDVIITIGSEAKFDIVKIELDGEYLKNGDTKYIAGHVHKFQWLIFDTVEDYVDARSTNVGDVPLIELRWEHDSVKLSSKSCPGK